MQEIGDRPNLRGTVSRQVDGLGEHFLAAVRFQLGIPQTAEIDAQGSQELRRAVVQFARDSASLVVLGAQQVGGKLVKLAIGLLQRFLGASSFGDVGADAATPTTCPPRSRIMVLFHSTCAARPPV